MNSLKILLVSFIGLFLLSGSRDAEHTSYYLRVPYTGPFSVKAWVDQGFELAGLDLEKKEIVLLVSSLQVDRFAKADQIRGLAPVETRPDSGYKRPDDIDKFVVDLEDRFPMLVDVIEIGRTLENRAIYGVRITSKFFDPGKEKPSILFDSMHHAREVMTPEVALDMMDYLTSNYETDPKVRRWVNETQIWIIPMVNPDGNQIVWSSSSMWRKNARGGYGVDNNRNYPYDWGKCNGSSGSQGSDTYRGSVPGSEPETKALMDLARRIKPVLGISWHSFSEIVIYPYGCSPKRVPSPDREILEGFGASLAGKFQRDSGQGTYVPGTSYQLLYNVDGGSIDWLYNELKTFSYVIEVNSSSQGFQPSYSRWRDSTIQRARPAWQLALDRMLGSSIRVATSPGHWVQIRDKAGLEVSRKSSGASGFTYFLLKPGKYTVVVSGPRTNSSKSVNIGQEISELSTL